MVSLMTEQDFKAYLKKINDGQQTVYPIHYRFFHENWPPAHFDGDDYEYTRQIDFTLGYLAGMKKARILLKEGCGKV